MFQTVRTRIPGGEIVTLAYSLGMAEMKKKTHVEEQAVLSCSPVSLALPTLGSLHPKTFVRLTSRGRGALSSLPEHGLLLAGTSVSSPALWSEQAGLKLLTRCGKTKAWMRRGGLRARLTPWCPHVDGVTRLFFSTAAVASSSRPLLSVFQLTSIIWKAIKMNIDEILEGGGMKEAGTKRLSPL